jgi:hypothetical protein
MHICNMRAKIDFDKVDTIEDLKLIIEAIQIEWGANNVPEKIKHLVTEYDANVSIVTY